MRWFRGWRRGSPSPALSSLPSIGFVAIDLETTGLDSRRDVIVSMAAVPFVDGAPRVPFATLVNCGRPVPLESTRIHGITDAMIAHAPPVAEALEGFDAVCADRILVGHRVAFDLAVLSRARHAAGRAALAVSALDTMLLAAALQPGLRDYSLEAVALRWGVDIVGRHTAEGDAVASGHILLALLEATAGRGYVTVADLIRLQNTVVLPA